MKKINSQAAIVAGLSLLFSMNCLAEKPNFPSHCLPEEAVFLSAKMKNVITNEKAISFKDSGKILSLCAEEKGGHIRRLTYRFGSIGNVELENVATTTHRFGTFSRQPVPHVGEDIYFFNRGEYVYYILVASGMGSGISLRVYRGNKQIVDMFSGNDADIDYYFGWQMKPNSVLIQRKPKHRLD
jgi:hypothetical protein